MHTAAREMVYVAEQGLMADGKNTLDPTWQEMLNHATSKVTEETGFNVGDYTVQLYTTLQNTDKLKSTVSKLCVCLIDLCSFPLSRVQVYNSDFYVVVKSTPQQ